MNTYDELANPEYLKSLIDLEKQLNPDKYILVTEGKGDNKVYEDLFDDLPIIILYGVGKDKCLSAVELANNDGEKDCAALIDSDFDSFDKTSHSCTTFQTDFPDIEGYTIHSEHWKKILQEIIIEGKLTKVRCSNLTEFRDKIIEISVPVGIVKYTVNRNPKYDYSLKKYKFDKTSKVLPKVENSSNLVIKRIIDLNKSKDWTDKENFEKLVLKNEKSVRSKIKKKQLLNSSIICQCIVDIINGKGLGNKLSGLKNINADGLRRIFRSSLTKDLFKKTNQYKEIEKWIYAT